MKRGREKDEKFSFLFCNFTSLAFEWPTSLSFNPRALRKKMASMQAIAFVLSKREPSNNSEDTLVVFRFFFIYHLIFSLFITSLPSLLSVSIQLKQ